MVADLYNIKFVVFSLFRDEKTTKLQNKQNFKTMISAASWRFLRQKRQIEL